MNISPITITTAHGNLVNKKNNPNFKHLLTQGRVPRWYLENLIALETFNDLVKNAQTQNCNIILSHNDFSDYYSLKAMFFNMLIAPGTETLGFLNSEYDQNQVEKDLKIANEKWQNVQNKFEPYNDDVSKVIADYNNNLTQ